MNPNALAQWFERIRHTAQPELMMAWAHLFAYQTLDHTFKTEEN